MSETSPSILFRSCFSGTSSLVLLRRLKSAASEVVYLFASWLIVWFVLAALVRALAPDPATQLAGPLTDEATRTLFIEEFGLDRPLVVESFSRAVRMLRGDWGLSWRTRTPVTEVVISAATLSIGLALIATAASLLTALAVTVAGRSRPRNTSGMAKFVDRSALWLFFAAIPAFVTALWLTHSPLPEFLALPRHAFRSAGVPVWKALVLPALCLALPGLGFAIPRLRAAEAYIVRSIWYRSALALGYSPRRALLLQGWPFLIGAIGDAFAQVLIASVTGAVAVEYVFSLPGLGTILVDAVQLGDVPVLLGVVATATFITYAALAIRAVCALPLPSHLRTLQGVV